jgi:hypothetical protein
MYQRAGRPGDGFCNAYSYGFVQGIYIDQIVREQSASLCMDTTNTGAVRAALTEFLRTHVGRRWRLVPFTFPAASRLFPIAATGSVMLIQRASIPKCVSFAVRRSERRRRWLRGRRAQRLR